MGTTFKINKDCSQRSIRNYRRGRWPDLGRCSSGSGNPETVSVVLVATVYGEVGRLMNKCSGLGIDTDSGGIAESTVEVNRSELVGIWSRDLSVTGQPSHDLKVHTQT